MIFINYNIQNMTHKIQEKKTMFLFSNNIILMMITKQFFMRCINQSENAIVRIISFIVLLFQQIHSLINNG